MYNVYYVYYVNDILCIIVWPYVRIPRWYGRVTAQHNRLVWRSGQAHCDIGGGVFYI